MGKENKINVSATNVETFKYVLTELGKLPDSVLEHIEHARNNKLADIIMCDLVQTYGDKQLNIMKNPRMIEDKGESIFIYYENYVFTITRKNEKDRISYNFVDAPALETVKK